MNLAEYFKANRYQPKYQIGDRVEGYYQKCLFVGSVGTDSIRSPDEEPHVTVTLDLPLMIDRKVHHVLRVPTKSVRLRK